MVDQIPERVLAAEKILQRRSARRSLTEWCRACGYEPAAHHQLIINHLEAVVRGEIRRLAIFLPPGAAKSTYSSVLFPPWYLAQGENLSILSASHSASLATKFGKKCRNLIDEHEKVLGYALAKDSQAADDWATSTGSVYFCAGVGGRIAGHRADLAIIDDPIGSIEDADSQLVRDGVWDWWEWNFMPRFKPTAAVVVISTRWHEDDLMGRLLQRERSRWTVLEIPMEAYENDLLGRKPGDRLWPKYFTNEMVEDAKANPRKWQGAYQQRPSPENGDYFRLEWMLEYDPEELPKELEIYAASDHSCSDKDEKKNDPTLLQPYGVDKFGDIWLLEDNFWEVTKTGTAVSKMLSMMEKHEPVVWAAEKDAIVQSIGPFLDTEMHERGLYYTRIEGLTTKGSKEAKCRSIQGLMEKRKVHFPRKAKWWPKAKNELLTFPVGTHDEFPDVLGVIGRFLRSIQKARSPIVKKPEPQPFTLGWLKREFRTQDVEEETARMN